MNHYSRLMVIVVLTTMQLAILTPLAIAGRVSGGVGVGLGTMRLGGRSFDYLTQSSRSQTVWLKNISLESSISVRVFGHWHFGGELVSSEEEIGTRSGMILARLAPEITYFSPHRWFARLAIGYDNLEGNAYQSGSTIWSGQASGVGSTLKAGYRFPALRAVSLAPTLSWSHFNPEESHFGFGRKVTCNLFLLTLNLLFHGTGGI